LSSSRCSISTLLNRGGGSLSSAIFLQVPIPTRPTRLITFSLPLPRNSLLPQTNWGCYTCI
jgi:hypothetical protein